jgi:hypothetical protein
MTRNLGTLDTFTQAEPTDSPCWSSETTPVRCFPGSTIPYGQWDEQELWLEANNSLAHDLSQEHSRKRALDSVISTMTALEDAEEADEKKVKIAWATAPGTKRASHVLKRKRLEEDDLDQLLDILDEWYEEMSTQQERVVLNGANGEWTGTDDMPRKRSMASVIKQVNANLPKISKKEIKKQARRAAIEMAATVIPKPVVKFGYKKVAKRVASMKKERIPRAPKTKSLHLSAVATKYLDCHVHPFDTDVSTANIPRPPAVRTYKATGFVRGSGVIGLAGVGYLAIAPTLANDQPCVYYTTAAYSLSNTSAPPADGSTGWESGGGTYPAAVNMTNLPYSSTNLLATATAGNSTGSQNDVVGRIVSSSAQLWYTGTTLNEGGQYYSYVDPDNNNVLGANHISAANGTGYYISQLAQKDATEIQQVRRNAKAQIVRLSTDPNMDDFPRNNNQSLRKLFPYSGGEQYGTGTGYDYLGCATAVIMIDGTIGQPFYFEVVTHVEYMGTGVQQALLSDSLSDTVGYDAVKTVLAHAQRAIASDPRLTFARAVDMELNRMCIRRGNGPRSVDY